MWSIACMAKLNVINSTIGLSPASAVPTPRPVKPSSVIGVSMTRRAPNSCSSPCVTLYAPWYSATSSPMTNTSGSRRISSAIASRNASRMVMLTISVPSGTSGSGAALRDGSAAGFADGAALSGTASGATTTSASSVLPSWRSAASSPSARMVAIGVLTATSAVPSGTNILSIVPSSTASTSMVALSVSISAITSPDLTVSPSFLSHLARLPFSIVGDRAGINTSVGMAAHIGLFGTRLELTRRRAEYRASPIDVGIKFCRIGFGVMGGEFGRLVDHRADRGVDLLQFVFAHQFAVEKTLAYGLDRIVLGADFVDFLLGPVFGRIGHRVAAVAVGHHFQNGRALAGATPGDGFLA